MQTYLHKGLFHSYVGIIYQTLVKSKRMYSYAQTKTPFLGFLIYAMAYMCLNK